MSFSEWMQAVALVLLAVAAAWLAGEHFGGPAAVAVGGALLLGIAWLLERKGV